MKKAVVVLLLAISTAAHAAPVPVRTANPEEAASRAAFLRFQQNVKLADALFGTGKLPKGCAFELKNPSLDWKVANIRIACNKSMFDYCDAITADCGN